MWILDTESQKTKHAHLSDAKYLTLHVGEEDYFSVVHHFDDNHLQISAHSSSAAESPLAKIIVTNEEQKFEGENRVWALLPKAYVAYYVQHGVGAFHLILIDAARRQVEFQQFDWYDEPYDHGYQGIIGVTEVPDQTTLLVSVQRDSQLVLYDPHERQLVRKIPLAAGKGGNPRLYFRRTANELWADDYDTLLRLDPTDWTVKNSIKLQDEASGTSQFIGQFAFNSSESLCAVARPFSGDVVAIDTHTFKVRHRSETGGQPLDVAILSDGRIFARDWKSGAVLQCRLKRKFFVW